MAKARKFLLGKMYVGEPKVSDFQLVEEVLPALQEGDILCESLWLSVDPYVRLYGSEEGKILAGGVVARITESKNSDFPKGRYLVGYFGWRDKTVYNPKNKTDERFPQPYLLPDFGDLPLSYGVGALGMPGVTANLAFLDICQPKPGETVVINAAAGAVGSLVGQIAKLKGCRVIGFAGSDDKIKWLKEKLGFDVAINYKKIKVGDALDETAPNGVDCYFDNVGGPFSNEVMARMNRKGRVTVCGAISGYNDGLDTVVVPMIQPMILMKELRVEGFIIWNNAERWLAAIKENIQWIKEGKLICEETITQGFENAPKAFIGLLRGDNTGKAVVRV